MGGALGYACVCRARGGGWGGGGQGTGTARKTGRFTGAVTDCMRGFFLAGDPSRAMTNTRERGGWILGGAGGRSSGWGCRRAASRHLLLRGAMRTLVLGRVGCSTLLRGRRAGRSGRVAAAGAAAGSTVFGRYRGEHPAGWARRPVSTVSARVRIVTVITATATHLLEERAHRVDQGVTPVGFNRSVRSSRGRADLPSVGLQFA